MFNNFLRTSPTRTAAPRRRFRTARPKSPVRRLRLEVLEDRSLMSVTVLNTLGNAAPGGIGFHVNDFEPGALNNKGDVFYGTDLGTANDPATTFGEGVFLQKGGGSPVALAYAGANAPGTSTTFGPFFNGNVTLNNRDDGAFVFQLNPVGSPAGVGSGAFRYSDITKASTPVVLPGVTNVPGGGGTTFAGALFGPSLNNKGDLVFGGVVPTADGLHVIGQTYSGVGAGVFESTASGELRNIVSPGDAAPGGGTFDYAANPSLNDNGTVAFNGHLAGEEVQLPGFPTQDQVMFPFQSLYLANPKTGDVRSLVHIGDAAPGGGTFRQIIFPDINNQGDVLFTGDLTKAPDANQTAGLFLYHNGNIISIAQPGDAMPGGGTFVTASFVGSNSHINNQGDVVFTCALSTDVDHSGSQDTGLFKWSHGQLSLIVRSGTTIPGVGTVQDLISPSVVVTPPPLTFTPNAGCVNNDRGQIFYSVLLTDGRDVLLLDTPKGNDGGQNLGSIAPQQVPASPPVGPVSVAPQRSPASPSVGSDLVASHQGPASPPEVPIHTDVTAPQGSQDGSQPDGLDVMDDWWAPLAAGPKVR
jgi:hypothetical protein